MSDRFVFVCAGGLILIIGLAITWVGQPYDYRQGVLDTLDTLEVSEDTRIETMRKLGLR